MRVLHKGIVSVFDNRLIKDRENACLRSLEIFCPLLVGNWKDVTCKSCLRTAAAKKYLKGRSGK